jgi:hypothetical protein
LVRSPNTRNRAVTGEIRIERMPLATDLELDPARRPGPIVEPRNHGSHVEYARLIEGL